MAVAAMSRAKIGNSFAASKRPHPAIVAEIGRVHKDVYVVRRDRVVPIMHALFTQDAHDTNLIGIPKRAHHYAGAGQGRKQLPIDLLRRCVRFGRHQRNGGQ